MTLRALGATVLAALIVTTSASAQDVPLEWIGRFSDGEGNTLRLEAGPGGVEGTLGIAAVQTMTVRGAPGRRGMLAGTVEQEGSAPSRFEALRIDDDSLLLAFRGTIRRLTRDGVPSTPPARLLPPANEAVPIDERQAVARALAWLMAHQDVDGSWSTDEWSARCSGTKCGGPRNEGDSRHRAGVTALATLALVRSGIDIAEWRGAAERAVFWLRAHQAEDGSIGFDAHFGESAHDHAWATLAMVVACAAFDDAAMSAAANGAVAFCLKAQNDGMGWKYGVKSGRNDTAVTADMIEALHAARAAGFAVPEPAFAGALAWVTRATDSEGSTGYETPGGGSSFLSPNDGKFDLQPVMTAAGVVTRRRADPRADVTRSTLLVLANKPVWHPRKLHFYYWYYGTRAAALHGGTEWKAWRTALIAALVPNQRRGGCASGSWDAIDEWGLAGGRVYATAINALTLTIDR